MQGCGLYCKEISDCNRYQRMCATNRRAFDPFMGSQSIVNEVLASRFGPRLAIDGTCYDSYIGERSAEFAKILIITC